MEKYWGQNILNTKDFGKEEFWYWASAGKTITSFLVGMAQQENRLSIEDKSSKYLGENWTTASIDDENLIRIRHQLSMSTGLDYEVGSLDCTDSLCLKYKKRAGTQWYYHNAPYTLLSKVIENATGMDYNDYTAEKLATTGMKGRWIQSDSSNLFWSTARDAARFGLLMMNEGRWIQSDSSNLFWSTARDAARFGLLMMNEGRWDKTSILKDSDYFGDMIEPSQSINKSYGYLWWLNGKESILYPGFTNSVPTSLAPSAPEDLYAAMGKNGQFIDVVPSDDLVVIRMGEAPDNSLVPIVFHDEMWKKINAIRKK